MKLTNVLSLHGSPEIDDDRMLNRRAAASAAALVLRGLPTMGQTDRQTADRCIMLTTVDDVSVKMNKID